LATLLSDYFGQPCQVVESPADNVDARVEIRALPWERYEHFIPPRGKALRALVQLVRLFAGDLRFDLGLYVLRDEVPPVVFSEGPGPDRLDYTCWLLPEGFVPEQDAEVVITAEVCQAALQGSREEQAGDRRCEMP
jgi:predicted component of type VI protein secretion system